MNTADDHNEIAKHTRRVLHTATADDYNQLLLSRLLLGAHHLVQAVGFAR